MGVSLLSVIASFFQGPFEVRSIELFDLILGHYFIFLVLLQVELPDGNKGAYNANITTANFTGFSGATFHENLRANYGVDYTSDGASINFALVFGVLFSGVTGIMAGANMSGELVNPGRSIPKGTISAVGFTVVDNSINFKD